MAWVQVAKPTSWCDSFGYANARAAGKERTGADRASGFVADVRRAQPQPIPTGGSSFDWKSHEPEQPELTWGGPVVWSEFEHNGSARYAVETKPRQHTRIRWTVQFDKDEQCRARARAGVRNNDAGAAITIVQWILSWAGRGRHGAGPGWCFWHTEAWHEPGGERKGSLRRTASHPSRTAQSTEWVGDGVFRTCGKPSNESAWSSRSRRASSRRSWCRAVCKSFSTRVEQHGGQSNGGEQWAGVSVIAI
jgi:hypothetical protein